MPIELVSQEQFVVNSVVKLVADQAEKGRSRGPSNSAIGNGVDELVRHNLRRLSQERRGFRQGEDLLAAAIEKSRLQLKQALDLQQLVFNMNSYFEDTKNSLKVSASELFELSRKLVESKNKRRIAEKFMAKTPDNRHTYEVSELGLLDSVEGLLATPTSDVKSLNIEEVRRIYPIQGEWFPFEVSVGDLLFVIDDDGVIFTSTENFPQAMMEKARNILDQIAEVFYSY